MQIEHTRKRLRRAATPVGVLRVAAMALAIGVSLSAAGPAAAFETVAPDESCKAI